MEPSQEQWRPIAGWEGMYEVSDHGRVRSLDRVITRSDGVQQPRKGQLLSTRRNPRIQYLHVVLPTQQGRRGIRVHTLVLETFVGPRPTGLVACHNDGDRFNNRVDNLRWDTQLSNNRDKIEHGTQHQSWKTHCPQGHPYDDVNTYINATSGARCCRQCAYEANRRHRAEKKERTMSFNPDARCECRHIVWYHRTHDGACLHRECSCSEFQAVGGPDAVVRHKTHCPQGHPYDGDNLYVSPSGQRSCRACGRDYSRRDRAAVVPIGYKRT